MSQQPDGTGLIHDDPWLEPYREILRDRFRHVEGIRQRLPGQDLLGVSSLGHKYFGLNPEGSGVWVREWAPGAHSVSIVGDFNFWNREANPLTRDEWGVWSVFLPDGIPHDSKVKLHIVADDGARDRLPAMIRRVVQEPDTSFTGVFWNPPEPFAWQCPTPALQGAPRIYEAHVGMASEDGHVGSFREFADHVLPRIAELGYNTVQLMAVLEHPFYGSFGYHVSNFFAVSSRFGTPEDLKALVDRAHGLGLRVILDLVHSHSVKNVNEGLNRLDGTDHQYFHAGLRGVHAAWDSLCFDYGQPEVLRFLLSNVRYWLEEFRFDGLRYDGVTSMLYEGHGLEREFSSYDDYFGPDVDWDAWAYLTLANELAHAIRPDITMIAEDVSGMPGVASPVLAGGLGFDYRLAMGIPDLWIKVLKEKTDEEWPLGGILHSLMDRRRAEKYVAYVESHDQALVGDQTVAFRLMGEAMYWGMSKFSQSLVVDRGLALHKMIRLITFAFGGEGYLNFMGNEFGHPEWIDFPRPGNDYSGHYARRQWSLVEQDHLHYHELRDFDRAMVALDSTFGLLSDPFTQVLAVWEDARVVVARRGPLVFAFNFSTDQSYTDFRLPVPDASDYALILDTDGFAFGGQGRVAEGIRFPWLQEAAEGCAQSLRVYLPARTAQVFAPVGLLD